MSNLLIVESENDKFFIEALITHLNIDLQIDTPICSIDEYDCIGGMGKLANRLEILKGRIVEREEDISKAGIIFDADNVGIETREQQIKEKINTVFGDNPPIQFSIFIMNIDGKGELETLLKAIKSNDSIIADCLDAWQQCIPKEKQLKAKDFDKQWIQIYQRYDCCNKKEKKQAERKCNNEISLKEKQIYNFDADIPELNALKDFLHNL